MCGIYGAFGLQDQILLKKSINSLSHRGPDAKGFFSDDNIMLGVTRLSIIDLKTGSQPIYNEDRSKVIVFNGEIYNYRELKAGLEKKGHRFSTETDTEVIIHAYEEYGLECLDALNGMFAFGIWDSDKKKLFIARDRYGVKPLYYWHSKDIFIFASEIKAILKYEEISRSINASSLPFYLRYRYIRNPDTFIREIKKLKPGCFIEIDNGRLSHGTYYSIAMTGENNSEQDMQKKIASLFSDSVKKRMIADVPVGLFLSGGLDSTSLLHYMNESLSPGKKSTGSSGKINTFTIGFEDDADTNEFSNARLAAEYYNTDHHEITVSMKHAFDAIPEVISHLEEPIADATAIPTFLLSKFASRHVKTVLAGEGADELFSGYVYYKSMEYYQKLRKIPFSPGKPISKAVSAFPNEVLDRLFHYPDGIGDEGKKRLLDLISENKSEESAYDSFISLFSKEDVHSMLAPESFSEMKKEGGPLQMPEALKKFPSIYDTIYNHDMTSWLPDYILTRIDKMSMENSLECREPFLDYRLVDYVSNIRNRQHYKDKLLLRRIMKNKIPAAACNRKKFPFYIPLTNWYDSGLKDQYMSVLESSRIGEDKIIKQDYIDSIFKSFSSSKLITSRKLWSLMTLELCYKKFIADTD